MKKGILMGEKSRGNWYFGDSEIKCDHCEHQNTKVCDDCQCWNKFKKKDNKGMKND